MEDDEIIDVAVDNDKNDMIDFGPSQKPKSIIKVIGVGGGGGNAVNHMYKEGIHDVSFVLCNTDAQALEDSPVPIHIQLGKEGLGAGNRPEKAREAAEETIESVRNMLNDGTRMAFITAGMGGGTGTGAAPVIARESKDMGILTVGIVTIPFKFEGSRKINQALDGVEAMEKNVDALLVINNERLRNIYSDISMMDAFAKADDTLSVAAKSIAEIITVHGQINLDFNDVKTVLKDGGVAIMSTGYGEGEGRVRKAIDDALNSPLLNDNDVFHSKRILIWICFSNDEGGGVMMEEMNDVTEFTEKFSTDYELKWGVAIDPTLGKKVKVTILATGFGLRDIDKEFDDRARKEQETEALTKQVEKEAKEREQKAREGRYYGPGNNIIQKRSHFIYKFSPYDLDNDELIMSVENSPTFSRSKNQYDTISRQGKTNVVVKRDDAPAEPEQSVVSESGKISF